jgi:hypothetical protein
MKTQEKEYLAAAYASAWNAVKKDSMVVSVLDNGWYLCLYGRGIPSKKCRAEKLLKGLAVLTGRLEQMLAKPVSMEELAKKYPEDFYGATK